MAEGKKSFVLYCDLIEVIEDLSLEQKGLLLETVLQYVNDLNPDIESIEDTLVKVSFKHIRQDLKRDLQKWKNIVERNKVNGAKGGRPRKNPENPVGILGNPKKPKKPDNDNDNDNDIINKDSHNEIFRKLWKSDQWLESVCMMFKSSKKSTLDHLDKFRLECITKEDFKVDEKDAKNHFVNWIKKGNPIESHGGGIILEKRRSNRNPE